MKEKCVVWGTGALQQHMADEIMSCYEIIAFCNSHKSKQGKKINGVLILSPQEVVQLFYEKKINCVIICATREESIRQIKEKIRREFPEQLDILYWKDIADHIENTYLLTVRKERRFVWNVDFETQALVWIQNFMSEVNFWVQYVANPKGEWHKGYLRRAENIEFIGLDKSMASLAQALDEDAVVMDIGCGIISMYGDQLPNCQKIQLLSIDPLAGFYNHINQKYLDPSSAGGGISIAVLECLSLWQIFIRKVSVMQL